MGGITKTGWEKHLADGFEIRFDIYTDEKGTAWASFAIDGDGDILASETDSFVNDFRALLEKYKKDGE